MGLAGGRGLAPGGNRALEGGAGSALEGGAGSALEGGAGSAFTGGLPGNSPTLGRLGAGDQGLGSGRLDTGLVGDHDLVSGLGSGLDQGLGSTLLGSEE